MNRHYLTLRFTTYYRLHIHRVAGKMPGFILQTNKCAFNRIGAANPRVDDMNIKFFPPLGSILKDASK